MYKLVVPLPAIETHVLCPAWLDNYSNHIHVQMLSSVSTQLITSSGALQVDETQTQFFYAFSSADLLHHEPRLAVRMRFDCILFGDFLFLHHHRSCYRPCGRQVGVRTLPLRRPRWPPAYNEWMHGRRTTDDTRPDWGAFYLLMWFIDLCLLTARPTYQQTRTCIYNTWCVSRSQLSMQCEFVFNQWESNTSASDRLQKNIHKYETMHSYIYILLLLFIHYTYITRYLRLPSDRHLLHITNWVKWRRSGPPNQ